MKLNSVKRANTFEAQLSNARDMYLMSVRHLTHNKMEFGSYFKKHNDENWLFFFDGKSGFIGEPMDGKGWYCWEFNDKFEYNHVEPMFYADLHWCIEKIKGVI